MKRQDFYEILGVDRDADEEAIKRAYRRVAKECHPDVTHGKESSTERFRRATEAYETLSDARRRAAYDRQVLERRAAQHPSQRRSSGRVWDFFDLAEQLIWNVFREMNGYPAWEGFEATLEISLTPEEARKGTYVSFDIPMQRECGICWGRGFLSFGVCPRCGGHGAVEGSRRVSIEIPAGVMNGDLLQVPVPAGRRIVRLSAVVHVSG